MLLGGLWVGCLFGFWMCWLSVVYFVVLNCCAWWGFGVLGHVVLVSKVVCLCCSLVGLLVGVVLMLRCRLCV